MDRMGHQEGDVIQHSMVTKSIERAQKRVEENNFGVRKRLLEYDDVMNIQREAIYKKRHNALSGERLSVDLHNMILGLTESMVMNHRDAGNHESFRYDSLSTLGLDPNIDEAAFMEAPEEELIDEFQDQAFAFYREKSEQIKENLYPIIEQVFENEGHRYKRIAIPFVSASQQPMPIAAELEKAVETEGKSIMRDIEKAVTLSIIDTNWKDHLRAMDELKESVQAASFEQKDPLVVYKMEAYELFEDLIHKINRDVTSYLFEGKIVFRGGEAELEEAKKQKTDLSKVEAHRTPEEQAQRQAAASAGQGGRQKVETFERQGEKIGRNDPCPCGSGKKYKHCHGRP